MDSHDLFPDGESGFALDLDLSAADIAAVRWVAALMFLAALAVAVSFFWLDRPAPALVQHHPASWVPAPTHRERAFAILEQPQGGRP